ncbi:Thymus-specific serine protease [Boothiomyces macroporosus]|uniref:Thymus-specific serine protease n=1 Tax=Boothiomyces macroporosus TaxID=261099 RepID=A0AAD5UK38_9FUNG|nr:Thymus-specific serine protease [Boothiomyces macroporosus]
MKFKPEIKDKVINYQYFDQLLDHNDPKQGTFKQRFYVDDEFYDKANGGPIFLEMGGESQINATFLPYELHYELAQRYKGLLIILEHRFYGADGLSPISEALGSPNMKAAMTTFNVGQALEDGYNFIKSYSKNVNGKSRWITVGGSYPGNLAAWMRMKYPDVVYAAHASSAPVLAKADFWEYGYAVDIGLAKSGGSDACAAGWRRAVKLNDADSSSSVPAAISRLLSPIVQYGFSPTLALGGKKVKLVDFVCSGNYLNNLINPNASDTDVLADYNTLYTVVNNQPVDSTGMSKDDLILWIYQTTPYIDHLEKAYNMEIEDEAQTENAKLIEILSKYSFEYEFTQIEGEGSVGEITKKYMDKHDLTFDMILIGTKERGNLEKYFLGSVSDYLMKGSVPVLIIK